MRRSSLRLPLFLVLVSTPLAAAGGDGVVARVGDQEIPASRLEERVRVKLRYSSYHSNPTPQQRRDAQEQALQELIEEELLLMEAARRKIAPSVEEIDFAVQQRTQQANKKLAAQMQSPEAQAYLRELVERQLKIERVLVRSNPWLLDKAARAEARKFFEKNRGQYQLPPSFHVWHALLKLDVSNLPVSRPAALARGAKLATELRAGKRLETLAEEFPDDLLRDLGWVHQGSLIPEVQAAVDKLQPGEVSEPIPARFGTHVVKVLAKRPARQATFDEVAENIVVKLAKDRAEESRIALLAECRKRWPVQVLQPPSAAPPGHMPSGHPPMRTPDGGP